MRSRWRGSMLAWILKTKPVNGGSIGATSRRVPSRGCGGGAHSTSACRISCTPKLLMPEPKKTGDWRPARNESRSKGELALRISSTSWRSAAVSSGKSSSRRGLPSPSISSPSSRMRSSPGVNRTRRSRLQIEHALKALAHADRPGDRRAVDLEHRLDLLEQRDRLAHLAIHLVHEGDDRRVAQAAYFEQLDRLRLDALGGIDHHHRGIDRGQHAIGVLGKVLVPGRVEQVDGVIGVVELHHRAGDRDAALLLDLHPVGCRVARALARLDRARHLDRAAEEQQLLGQRRLARIRVRDDGERAAPRDIADEIRRKRSCSSSSLRAAQRDADVPFQIGENVSRRCPRASR